MRKVILSLSLALAISLSFVLCPQTTYAIDIYTPNPENEVITCSDFDMVIRPKAPAMEGSDVITPVSAARPTGTVHIVINKSERKLFLYDNGNIFKEYPVAVGKAETPTPVGEWKITSKGMWGGGFGTRWMGLNVPWGKYGIHGTNKPYSIGTYASHGCIRMFNRDVEELYSFVDIGTPVIIEGNYPHLAYRTVKPGTASKDMLHVQKRLRELGLYWGPIDGRYGKMTEMSTTYFQLLNNEEADGIIDDSYYEILQLK
ncbi:L,D-transpeptidase family protein [Desulfitibacter alkalitolerans]|uniref:L,D-transpeptidase family protein n=1 Tax=Desulfitibacter alkalitolerans TaxID=264641 RepID=UPI000482478E|nr:L,D-transpeptidase family protein [Desulfitibacter alkalitolerans]